MLRRIKSSIFIKMFLSIFCILMITSFFIYGMVMVLMPQSYQFETNQRFSENMERLSVQLETVTRKEAEKILTDFCIENNAAATLQSKSEILVYGDISDIQQNGSGEMGATQVAASVVRFPDSEEAYTLMISQVLNTVNEITAAFWRLLPWIFLLVVLISAAGSFACSKLLSKPVLEISRISNRMSKLDMTWHCDVRRSDELGILADSLNAMGQKLHTAMAELENANQQLQADIEKEKLLEKQRRTFFAAVSHELKTPITILKGQVESMIYGIGDYKNKEKYLPLALETVERMEHLVREILTVSKLTSDGFQLSVRPLDLAGMVRECLTHYEPLALKKNIELDSSHLENVTMAVDKKLFEKMFSNILSNAVFYSPNGARVTVTLTSEALTVENTGTHLPEERLTDLFSPLTRVEESRNKHTGGSGLGLYLVKTILDLHGIPFGIQNSQNGVCFTVLLHQNQN